VLTTVSNNTNSTCGSINRAESSSYTAPSIHSESAPSSTSLEGALGVEVVDVYKVDIAIARRKELHQVTGSNRFRSQYQACAIELSSQHKSDLLVALGAGGGASLLFTLCVVNRSEEHRTTVVIVPSVQRLNSLKVRLKNARASAREWKVGARNMVPTPQVLLVFAATAATAEFREFIVARCREKVITRIIFDRIEAFVSPPLLSLAIRFNFREKLAEGLVPFLGTSTALPPDVISKIMRQMHFRPRNTHLVQDPSLLHNSAHLSVFPLLSQANCSVAEAIFSPIENQTLSVLNHVRGALDKFQAQDRALIFCSSSRVADDFAAALPCLSYPVGASEDGKKSVMDSWRAGNAAKALAITSGSGVDFDYDNIQLVIHYEAPQNIYTFLRESAKAGRSGQPAYVTTFWHASVRQTPASNTDDLGVEEMIAYLRTDHCRRVVLLPPANTCGKDSTAALCDNCLSQLAHASIVSLWRQLFNTESRH
jgi:superfamily II DNA helicase RecQ